VSKASWTTQDLFRDLTDGREARSAADQDATCAQSFKHSGLAKLIAQHFKQFAPARLQNLCQSPLRHQARWALAYRWHLDFVPLRDTGHYGGAEHSLDFVSLSERCSHANCDVIREVIAANWDHAGMGNGSLIEDDNFSRPSANVDKTDAEFALIGIERSVGAGQRLEDDIGNVNARLIGGSH